MKKTKSLSYLEARDVVLACTHTVSTERIPLECCAGRVLAEPVVAIGNVPSFDRSPYDGYAFRSADTINATRDFPVTLRILEEIPAGGVSHVEVVTGTAVKILTGAPIPTGADAVIMYEKTSFTSDTVTITTPSKPGDNIVRTGEDVKKGTVLAYPGMVIDAGLMGTMASQNITSPLVYRKPVVGLLSTGSELQEVGASLSPGQIYNTNRYSLTAVLEKLGCETVWLGTGKDTVEEIAALFEKGLSKCDAIISTGGVSVGDYDLTPAAIEANCVKILFDRVAMKPGMACAYGHFEGKPVMGLSGNPASALTNFYAIGYPVIRKLCGHMEPIPEEIEIVLENGFKKASKTTRILRGALVLFDGVVRMRLPEEQGNVVLSSTIGCNVLAVVPAGSGPVEPGTRLKGFLL